MVMYMALCFHNNLSHAGNSLTVQGRYAPVVIEMVCLDNLKFIVAQTTSSGGGSVSVSITQVMKPHRFGGDPVPVECGKTNVRMDKVRPSESILGR